MSKEQTALERIKDEVAKEMMFDNAKQAALDRASINEIAKRFASQAVEDYKEKLKAEIEEVRDTSVGDPAVTSTYDNCLKLIDSIK